MTHGFFTALRLPRISLAVSVVVVLMELRVLISASTFVSSASIKVSGANVHQSLLQLVPNAKLEGFVWK